MFVRGSLFLLMLLGPSACDSGGAPTPGSTPESTPATSTARETVSCAQHYGELREAILGALRGSEKLPLIAPVTQHSTGVLSPLAAGKTPADVDCRSANRSLRAKRSPGSAWTVAPECAALIERIDAVCLKPLVERGEPLSAACNTTLIGMAGTQADSLQRIMGNGGFCGPMIKDL